MPSLLPAHAKDALGRMEAAEGGYLLGSPRSQGARVDDERRPQVETRGWTHSFQGLPCRAKIAKDQDGGGNSKVHAISCVSNMRI